MENREFDTDNNKSPLKEAHGPQGVDKAPGEETASGPDQFLQQTQKGKNQVDGDPDNSADQPINQNL